MFKIGEFSRIARISIRQLRHYDEIDLFKPQFTDPETGYRYYSADQLPQLNRILAFKGLGMSLDQIARLLNEDISAQEIHGMLTLRKSQLERELQEQLEQVRSIETRIWEIETEGVLSDANVLVKRIPQQQFLSTRRIFPTVKEGFALLTRIHRLLPDRTGNNIIGKFGVLFHSEGFETENLDVEMGILLEQPFLETLSLSDDTILRQRTVPAVSTMATLARVGIYNDSIGHYGALGHWIEQHDYQIMGPGWEVLVEPFQPGHEDTAVVEIRIPVQRTQRDVTF